MTERTDLELIDHFLERGSDEQRRAIEAELTTSASLKRRYDDLAAVWRLLGRAEATPSQRDLWADVSDRLGYAPQRRRRAGWWARAAAAVVLAATLGYGTARIRLQPRDVEIAETEVTEQLRLSALGYSTVYQFGNSLLDNESTGSN